MEKEAIEEINLEVYRQYPYLKDIEPKITSLENGQFLLSYHGQAETADGHALPVTLHVTINDNKEILKFSSSR